jgi:hypothetical protein
VIDGRGAAAELALPGEEVVAASAQDVIRPSHAGLQIGQVGGIDVGVVVESPATPQVRSRG